MFKKNVNFKKIRYVENVGKWKFIEYEVVLVYY